MEIDGSNNSSNSRPEPLFKCQLGADRNVISHFYEAANTDSTKFVRLVQAQKLKDTSEATVWPKPNSTHGTLP